MLYTHFITCTCIHALQNHTSSHAHVFTLYIITLHHVHMYSRFTESLSAVASRHKLTVDDLAAAIDARSTDAKHTDDGSENAKANNAAQQKDSDGDGGGGDGALFTCVRDGDRLYTRSFLTTHTRAVRGASRWCKCSCDVQFCSLLCCTLVGASALVTIICVLCTPRTQIL
jgi:hypothetical protein